MSANPTQQRTVFDMPTQYRVASIVPNTYNADENSIVVVWTTGARRRAYDWYNDQVYEEELVVDAEAVDMTRFEAGTVQVLDNHSVYGGVASILGIAERGWLEGNEGLAKIRLSQRPELAGIVMDIKAGIIRSISFGYSVERYEIIRAQDRTDGVNLPLYRATRWTPQEISFVTVPADPNAQSRAEHGSTNPSRSTPPTGGRPCEFVRAAEPTPIRQQEIDMPGAANPTTEGNNTPATVNEPTTTVVDASRAAQDAAAQAAARSADITELCVRHNVPHMAAALIRSGKTVDQASSEILTELARTDAARGNQPNVRVETVRDETETRMAGIEEALMHRVHARAQLTDNGRQYRGMTLLEIGRDMLHGFGVNTRGMDKLALATRILNFRSGAGMLSTSDFGNLLANVASKRLRMAYDENPGSYTRWARRAPNAPDFKAMTVVQLSGMPDLLQVNEHGEFKYGALSDGKETYSLLTYGRIVSLSRQAFVNDDLRGFDRLLTGFGSSAARLENRVVYSQLTANAAMGDGTALFHANHGNLGTGAGSALQFSALTTARAAMRKQKGLQNEELNLAPSTLIVPAALEQTAYQLTSSNYMPATKAEVNEFRAGGKTALDPVIEPILDGVSATAWYLAANNSQVDTVEYCYLDGGEGPIVESEMGFEVDGISFKCREDFAAKAIDWRGLYRGDGA